MRYNYDYYDYDYYDDCSRPDNLPQMAPSHYDRVSAPLNQKARTAGYAEVDLPVTPAVGRGMLSIFIYLCCYIALIVVGVVVAYNSGYSEVSIPTPGAGGTMPVALPRHQTGII
jgi:hypothetical protein